LSLISDGTSIGAVLDGTTPSGEDVFFATRAQLLPGEDEGELEKVYDARVNGGFPPPPPPPAPCTGAACRPPAAPPAAAFSSIPPSATLIGAGTQKLQGPSTPIFTLAPIGAAQRRALAGGGKLALKVTGSAPDTFRAKVLAAIGGHSRQVAAGTA